MHRSLRRVALAVGTALTLATALTVATASAAGAGIDLSSRAAIERYLISIGVDPADAVWQTGLKNYAGPTCPGLGWKCVRANAPIVQIGPAGGRNLFSCAQLECVAIQVLQNGGQNASACERRVEGPSETIMVCDITQANGPGTNAATISQHIQQTRGSVQAAREVARITQVNGRGSNIARIIQGIGQSSRTTDSAQIQEAHQAATVMQATAGLDLATMLGDNTSNVRQTQDQLQRASGQSVMQMQNTETGSYDSCDQPGEEPYDQDKSQCASVTQHSGVVGGIPLGNGGANRSTLSHEMTQRQLAANAEQGVQDQGALFDTGEGGEKEQLSTGVSEGAATQDMLQVQTAAPGASAPLLVQSQDTGDPRCCWNQIGNDANRAEIAQRTVQNASSDSAIQTYYLEANCLSTGTCHATQSAIVDGEEDASAECPEPESEVDNACFLVTTNADVGEG